MRYLAPFALILFSGCCSSLPKLAPKHVPFPDARAPYESAVETTGRFYDDLRQRNVPIHTYTPIGMRPPFPIVIVSHGTGEDRESYEYLGQALARAGFYAVHLTHAGTGPNENQANRALDVSFVLDKFATDDVLDISRVAVVGHAAGGDTALLVAKRDKRVKAIVSMSAAGSDNSVAIPVLNLTGACDRMRIGYRVMLKGVNPNTFSAADDPHHAAIAAITVAFLRGWILGDAAARAWFDDAGCGEAAGTRLCVEHK